MSLFEESFAIFRRNPSASIFIVVLLIAASAGQLVSLGSLYPILQTLVSNDAGSANQPSGFFVSALNAIGVTPNLTNLLLLFIVLGLGYSLLNWCADAYQGAHLRNFEIAVRRELLESAVMANWTYVRALRHGEFINVVTREAGQYKFVVKFSLYTFGCFIQFVVLLGYALYLNWRLTSFGLMIFAAGSMILIPMLKSANRLGRQSTDIANNMSNRLVAALRSLKMVKALSLERSLVRTLQPSFELSSSNYFYQNLLASGQWAITEIIAFIAISSMLFVGLSILAIPKAELFIILLLLFRALPQVRSAIDNYHRAYGYLPSMQAVRQHLAGASSAIRPHQGLTVPPNWTQIEFQDVCFAYEDGKRVIHDLSFNIRRGEFWTILGHSGSGKTTLLDILIGLFQPQKGTVRIAGVSLNEADLDSWHSQLSYLGQEAYVFAGTLGDNLIWGSEHEFSDSELLSALRAVKLEGISTHGADVLSIDVGENGCNLSGGEKQRLALARLFLRHAGLTILDEPTTGLDASTEKEIFDGVSTYFHDTTLIIVSHREELAHHADHILRLTPEGILIQAGNEVSRGAVVS